MSDRVKVKGYTGIYYRISNRIGKKGDEKIYYVVYKKVGKLYEEKVGRQFVDDMTPARATVIRAELIEGKRLSRKEIKQKEMENKKKEADTWTLDRLFEKYKESRTVNKALKTDEGRYKKYLKEPFGHKQPIEIKALEVEALKNKLLKTIPPNREKPISPQTVAHILNLLTWIINYGTDNNLCSGLTFRVKKPEVHNEKTEDLSDDELTKLLKVLKETSFKMIANIIRFVLYTGMRRGEILNLEKKHINFQRKTIAIKDPKGGPDATIPLNSNAETLIKSLPKSRSKYVFPTKERKCSESIDDQLRAIKKQIGLPDDFRMLHGLRHFFASNLASSGEVDLYTIQKLLTHKDPRMTQRYAHLRDAALKKASELAGNMAQGTL